MRIVSGILAILLGLAALLGGIGLQTIWAPPQTMTATVGEDPKAAPLTVITGDFQSVDEDPVDYTLTGEGDYTVMLGRQRDIDAWVAGAAHNTVKGIETDVPDGQQPRVIVEHTDGEAVVPTPVDSDLWIETHQASGTLEQRWTLPEEDQTALLIAVDGTQPAPAEVTVTWTNRVGDSPWILPLLIIGPLLMLVGLGLLLWAWLRHRSRGQRGGTTAPAASTRSGRRAAGASTGAGSSAAQRVGSGAAVGLLALTVALPGSATASPTASPQSEDHIPIVVDQQLERILGRVQAQVARADKTRKVDALGARASGEARAMRELNYRNQGIDDSIAAPAPIAADPILASAATEDPAFPRTVVVVTQGKGNETPQLMMLRQQDPRSQYAVEFAVPMAPGTELTGSTVHQGGVRLQDHQSADGLLMSPLQAVEGVAAMLTDPGNAFSSKVAPSVQAQAVQKYQEDLRTSAPDAEISLNRQRPSLTTVVMPDGSALVFASLDNNVNAKPKEAGGKVIASPLAQKLAGQSSNEVETALYMRYRETMVLQVPAAGATGEDAKVTLVGFDDELSSVSYRD